ncbi:Uncharacterised protein [Sebaldella termitidis]|jgi:hypothetical protein|uniref:Uncharacterized protein n=1 Tax=Sebaldella termitidis (strain ATCC 33386 / NCTC 11300) TaxID=526218 RepID=D1ARZ0_SEBTE|nr:hypothetical protein [Sebaldella termitidis]ACZ10977.1 hypothetical protein Sterm_4145 [Sebaldella termitidis ATCC 33386]MBP7725697.1 hypothetical protein [Leptotrichiaceae bacterium]SUI81279.1 Uncharacterised protein [Sebaldella termitidis]
MIVLYLGNLLIGQIKNIEELNDFLKEEIERINELRNKGYYVRFPKWAKLKKDYKILPENSITLNSDRFAERKEFLIMSKKNKYGYEPIISNFVGYQKIAKLNFENDDQVEISLNSFEIYENPDGKGIHGRSYVTLLKNKEYISKDKKITEMYNHDVVYAEDISNFQIVADIITERFIQLDIKIKNVEYFNSDIKFVKVWEGNLCM